MNYKNKILFVILVLFISIGCVSASGDATSYDDTGLSDVGDANVLSSVESSSMSLGSADSAGDDYYSDSGNDDILQDDEDFIDTWNWSTENYTDEDWKWDYEESGNSSDNNDSLFSYGEAVEIITSNLTKYDFDDAYKVKIVDDQGRPVYDGQVDFYIGRDLIGSSYVSLGGFASFNLRSAISTAGTYDIISIYTSFNGSVSLLTHQRIDVDEVPPGERDARIIFENIKLYDPGETYSIKVVDKNGTPIKNGSVCFVIYDRVIYCKLNDSGIASCVLPNDLNFTGNLMVWSIYSDGNFYDYSDCEQISIGTRTLISLDKSSIGAHMLHSWNDYNFSYAEGKYVASLDDETYLVLGLNGNVYLLREHNATSAGDLNNLFSSLTGVSRYDVVQINLQENSVYSLGDSNAWSDKEWDYYSRISYGQLIINGNGATLKGNNDNNFMFIGSEANVYISNATLKNFNHCFMNYGSLYCINSTFDSNCAYRIDVKVEGSGAVLHNYNTALIENCEFYNNTAEYMGLWITDMPGSILYAEPSSLTLFKDMDGYFRSDSFYAANYSTVIVYYDEMNFNLFKESEFQEEAYFVLVDNKNISKNDEWVVDVSSKNELIAVFKTLNSFINASSVVINLAPGTYSFSTSDYDSVREYDWRAKIFDDALYVPVNESYLLDVGFSPVTINGNGAEININGNDEDDDYHFAHIGRYGALTLNDLYIKKFNTAVVVDGTLNTNNTAFVDNIIDHDVVSGDIGGAIRSYGGTVIMNSGGFSGNRAGNENDDDGICNSDDIYADKSSYVELRNIYEAKAYIQDSYIKAMGQLKDSIILDGNSFFEEATNNEPAFKMFNVSDDASYQKVLSYLATNHPSSLYINFTGDYTFKFTDVFDRSMSVTFCNNGYNVKFKNSDGESTLVFNSTNAMTFINFNFNDCGVLNNGSCTFINCSFSNNEGDEYFILNDGSMTFINCSFFNNNFDDELICNHGFLSIYDSIFFNNTIDDYGIIYNEYGSFLGVNTTFEDDCVHVFNFATGSAAFCGIDSDNWNVEFDQPWANWTAGLVKGAFLLGTAMLTYGAGAGIGVVLPGVAGLVVSSIAGAGIGFACGVGYGAIEGYMYHDYSGIWMNGLSFAMVGFSMAQMGFFQTSNFIHDVRDVMNEEPGAIDGGNPAGDAPQNPGGNQPVDFQVKDADFLNALKDNIINDFEQLANHVSSTYHELVQHIQTNMIATLSNPQATAVQLLNLYSTMQSVLAADNALNNQIQNNVENIVNRIENNLIDNIEINHVENPPLFINEEGNRLVNIVLSQSTFLQRSLAENPNLSYLTGRINTNTFNLAEQNQTHAMRVLNLLNDFSVLYNRARNLGFEHLSREMVSYLNLYNDALGQRARSEGINAMFDPNQPSRLKVWETIYNNALDEYNRIINISGIDKDIIEDKDNNVSAVLKGKIEGLLDKMENKFPQDTGNYTKYASLRNMYDDFDYAYGENNIDQLLTIYNGLVELDNIYMVDQNRYQQLLSFDYVAFIGDNPINSLFNHPKFINGTKDVALPSQTMLHDLKMLKSYNSTLYEKILSDVFNGADLKEWTRNAQIADYKSMYVQIHDYLISNNYADELDEDCLDFYLLKNLLKNPGQLVTLYSSLSDSMKIMVNKYMYDKCSELVETFNGVYYMHGIKDFHNDLVKLSNITDVSNNYFRSLTTIYVALQTSRGVENIFNKDLSGLSSESIRDILLNEMLAFNLMHNQFSEHYRTIAQMNFDTLIPQVIDWANKDQRNNLTDLYGQFKYVHDQLSIFYKLDYSLWMNLPLDIDLYKKLNHIGIVRVEWSNDLGSRVSVIFGNVIQQPVLNTIKNQFNSLLPYGSVDVPTDDPQAREMALREQQHRSNIMYMEIYNLYLKLSKNSKINMSDLSLLDLMVIEGTNLFSFSKLYDENYYKNITARVMDEMDFISLQKSISPVGQKMFREIDVAHLETRLKAFQESCPVGYWLLREYLFEKYGKYTFTHSRWTYDEELEEFCTLNANGVEISYSNFYNEMVNKMKTIISSLGVLEGNNTRFESLNYTVGRFNTDNPYDAVFNKPRYYETLDIEGDYDHKYLTRLSEDMENDLKYIKNINKTLYDKIMADYFDGAATLSDWIENQDSLSWDELYAELASKYRHIFDDLGKLRNNTFIINHEADILLPQLVDGDLDDMDGELYSTVRSKILKFIYFWEFAHKLTNDMQYAEMDSGNMAFVIFIPQIGHMTVDLLEKPTEELLEIYKELLYRVSYRVFDEEYDFNSMSVLDVQNALLDNMYRAYYCSNSTQWIFDLLKENNIPCENFDAFRKYILDINQKQALIDLYDLIHNAMNIPKNVYVDDINKVKQIILDTSIADTENIYNESMEDACYFMGSWNLIAKDYPQISKDILKNLMKGDLDNYLMENNYDYNKIRAQIHRFIVDYYGSGSVPSSDNVPSGDNVPAGIAITREELDDIISIMRNKTIEDTEHAYEDDEIELQNITGSWLVFYRKYVEISDYVLENLLGGDFERYTLNLGWDNMDQVREDIIKFLEDIYNNKIAVSDQEYNDIKNIMQNNTIYPKKTSYVISDSMIRLYGSWELIESKYPLIAAYLMKNLFNGNLQSFAVSCSNENEDFRAARLKIIEFIQKNFNKKDSENSQGINDTTVYNSSVDDVYTYTVNQILLSNLDSAAAQKLLDAAESNYNAYIQFLDMMISAGVPADRYENKLDQFKDRFMEILKQINANSQFTQAYEDVINIMLDKTLPTGKDITTNEEEYIYDQFMASWEKLETDYPDIAKVAFEKLFQNNLNNIKLILKVNGDDATRQDVIIFAQNYLKYYANASQSGGQNPGDNIEKFVILQQNVAGQPVDQIKTYMANARDDALGFAERIKVGNPNLSAYLVTQINKLYDEYLLNVENYNPQWQYKKFIMALNDLFKNVNASLYPDTGSADKKSFIIKKDSTKNFDNDKFLISMNKALDTCDQFVKEINKTNPILANRIYEKARSTYQEFMDKVIGGGAYALYYYNDFIKILNALLSESIASSEAPKYVENSKTADMSNEDILKEINNKLSQKLNFPSILQSRFNTLKNMADPERQDLLDLLKDVNAIYFNLKLERNLYNAIEGKIEFFADAYYPAGMSLGDMKKTMRSDLAYIQRTLPNLYNALVTLYNSDLDAITSLEDCDKLRKDYRDYCKDYFKLLGMDKKWFGELNRDYAKNKYLNNAFFTYFSINGAELGFTKNLNGSDHATVKAYIINEMNRLKTVNYDLYSYYMDIYFGSANYVEEYLSDMESQYLATQLNVIYLNFYNTIKDSIQPSRDVLQTISMLAREDGKYEYYLQVFVNSTGINLDAKAAYFTKVLLKSIININNYKVKSELYEKIINGTSINGIINAQTKAEIKRTIQKYVGIKDGIMLDDDEFEILTGLINHNLNPQVRALLISRYVKIINNDYSSENQDYKHDYEYNRIYFEYLKYRSMFVNKVIFYKEEMDILNNLKSLKSYEIINEILDKKLMAKYRGKNIIAEGYVNNILNNNVTNSLEYSLITKGADFNVENLGHISIYYRVFTHPNRLSNNLSTLIDEMQADLDAMNMENRPLYLAIREKYFPDLSRVENINELELTDVEKLNTLKKIYKDVYDYLANLRDNNVVNALDEYVNNGA